MAAKDIAEKLNEMRLRLDVSFVLQTLEYLHKGGRCSGVAALGANLLKLRPEIVVSNEGTMSVGRKYRGNMEKTVLDYIRGRLEGNDNVVPGRIMITHTDMPQEIVDKAYDLVKSLHPFQELEAYVKRKFPNIAEEYLTTARCCAITLGQIKENATYNNFEMGNMLWLDHNARKPKHRMYFYRFDPEIPGWDDPGAFRYSRVCSTKLTSRRSLISLSFSAISLAAMPSAAISAAAMASWPLPEERFRLSTGNTLSIPSAAMQAF